MSAGSDAAQAALVVLGGPGAASAAGALSAGRDLSLTPDAEVAALMAVVAAPLPDHAPRERARAGGALLAVLGLVVLAVFVALPLQVAAGAVLEGIGLAVAVAVLALVAMAVALRVLLGRVCAGVPLRARTMVPTGLRRGRRRAGGGRGSHVLTYRDQDPTET